MLMRSEGGVRLFGYPALALVLFVLAGYMLMKGLGATAG